MQKLKQAAEQCPSDSKLSKWIVLIRVVLQLCTVLYHLFNAAGKLVAYLLKLGGHS
ncbi:hypothetical protein [Burkholderia stabilis]